MDLYLVPDDAEQPDWNQLTTTAFFDGYSDEDALYDDDQTK